MDIGIGMEIDIHINIDIDTCIDWKEDNKKQVTIKQKEKVKEMREVCYIFYSYLIST